jgi:site-specific recombinase XerD
MYASGTRAQEICDLTVADVVFDSKGAVLTITGKGQKTRRCRIAKDCGSLLRQYMAHRGITGSPKRHIFSSQTHEHMTVSCVEGIFKKYVMNAKAANPTLFPADSYPPHSMRHTTASHMLEAGVPLTVIKNFLGHASLMSTQVYAEMAQGVANEHLVSWNAKWFSDEAMERTPSAQEEHIPGFLR